ncbi:hypothetical protein DFH06DRAFT_1101086 [Mycena polygramma]|nr:hypothetical protein DFH06DRAFT_1101086 [Mycena polygramma]
MTIAPFDVPGFERHAEGVQSPVPGAEVHPLLPFANLTFLLIGPCLGFDVDDDIVADMARAWPRIETLGLLFRTRATLRCLRSFASLPHLTSLKMMLDATTIPLPETGAVAFQHKALYAFDAWYSEVTSPADVAEFLCRLFPGLRLIRSALSDAYTEEDSYDGSASDSDMWEAVQDHIHLQLHRALNSARK